MPEWNEFSAKRIIGVKQRVQTVVVYEYLNEVRTDMEKGEPIQAEAIVDSFDRPIQADYT